MPTATRNLKFRVSTAQHQALRHRAAAENVSASEYVRRVIGIACDEPDPLPKGRYRPRKT